MSDSYVMKQGDTFPPIELTVYDPAGLPFVIPEGTTVKFHMGKSLRAGASFEGTGEVISADSGKISYQWGPGDTDTPGGFLAEFQLTLPDGRVLTVPNDNWIEIEIVQQLG